MSIFKAIAKVGKGALSVIAPELAGALPGPLGARAKSIVENVLGLSNSSEEEIEKALAVAHPEVLERLRKADQDFRLEMEKLGVDLQKAYLDDRANARARQIAVKDKTLPALAWVVMGMWAGCIAALFKLVPPSDNKDLLLLLLGVLTGGAKDVIGYFFGSSVGSARKTEMMGDPK